MWRGAAARTRIMSSAGFPLCRSTATQWETTRAFGGQNLTVASPYDLPPDLPVPVDDGACDHLPGMLMPPLELPSTRGRVVNLAMASRRPTVFFFYPAATGMPDAPRGWDLIPGARGCTAQNCAYRDHHGEFRALGFEVYGVSAQPLEEQREFASRMHILFELLNDSGFGLTVALRLPTFEFQGRRYIKRLSLVVRDGRIEKVFYPVFPPDRNAEVVLGYLRGRRGTMSSGRG